MHRKSTVENVQNRELQPSCFSLPAQRVTSRLTASTIRLAADAASSSTPSRPTPCPAQLWVRMTHWYIITSLPEEQWRQNRPRDHIEIVFLLNMIIHVKLLGVLQTINFQTQHHRSESTLGPTTPSPRRALPADSRLTGPKSRVEHFKNKFSKYKKYTNCLLNTTLFQQSDLIWPDKRITTVSKDEVFKFAEPSSTA